MPIGFCLFGVVTDKAYHMAPLRHMSVIDAYLDLPDF